MGTVQTSTSISLSWSASVVQSGSVAHTGAVTTASISGLTEGTLYTYAVSAERAAGEGEKSSELSQSSAPGAPAAPTSTLQTSTSISLSWNAPASDSSSGDDATRYRVYDVGGVAP